MSGPYFFSLFQVLFHTTFFHIYNQPYVCHCRQNAEADDVALDTNPFCLTHCLLWAISAFFSEKVQLAISESFKVKITKRLQPTEENNSGVLYEES